LKILCVCPSSFAANTYLLVSNGSAFVVDPSVSVTALERALGSENAQLCGILLTHGHFDHTISVDTIREKLQVPLMMHGNDAPMLTNGLINGFYDFYQKECIHNPADRIISNGEQLFLGDETIKVISTPGHSPGSVCYLCKNNDGMDFLITGDTLFASSIGRCDLWNGSEKDIAASILHLSELNGKIQIYPGHGASCSLENALTSARFYIDF